MSSCQPIWPGVIGATALGSSCAFGLNSRKTAPPGSETTAKRPTSGISVGGRLIAPPAAWTPRASASTSSTEMYPDQQGGTPSARTGSGIAISPATITAPLLKTVYVPPSVDRDQSDYMTQ